MARRITMIDRTLPPRDLLRLLSGETRNKIYTEFLSDAKGVYIELDSSGVYAKGTDNDRLALMATSKQVHRDVSSVADLATTFKLQPPYTTTAEGNEIMCKPFDLDAWLEAKDPYHFTNAKHITLHIGRLRVGSSSGSDAEMADLANIEHSIPLDSLYFLKREVDLSICLSIECPTGKPDIQLRISLNDIRPSIWTA